MHMHYAHANAALRADLRERDFGARGRLRRRQPLLLPQPVQAGAQRQVLQGAIVVGKKAARDERRQRQQRHRGCR